MPSGTGTYKFVQNVHSDSSKTLVDNVLNKEMTARFSIIEVYAQNVTMDLS